MLARSSSVNAAQSSLSCVNEIVLGDPVLALPQLVELLRVP